MTETNFLIGRGELLTQNVVIKPGFQRESIEIYSYDYAVEKLSPDILDTVEYMDALPNMACPGDYSVARILMNPSYISRSSFPSDLLKAASLIAIGSKNTKIKPERWKRASEPEEVVTTELLVAAKRDSFRSFVEVIKRLDRNSKSAIELTHIEKIGAYEALEKLKIDDDAYEGVFEVGINLIPNVDYKPFIKYFISFVSGLDGFVYADLAFKTGNLWFAPIELPRENLAKLAEFSLVRVIRKMPQLRSFRPLSRVANISSPCTLNTVPVSNDFKAAILDGGIPLGSNINGLIDKYYLVDPDSKDLDDGPDHGLAVTSAFLFGSIKPNQTTNQPYCKVDHYRVLDEGSLGEGLDLYRTLAMIEDVLRSKIYAFINISLGPNICAWDDDVHPWTSVIDELLQDGQTFLTIAAGNNGHLDAASRNNRIQVPSDCVNAVAVGAVTTSHANWERAFYSAVGPGRSPGLVKPDMMAFGGSPAQYFHVLAPGIASNTYLQMGTSFAAPHLLRQAAGVKAILGEDISVLAIKALLVHSCDPMTYTKLDVGWGKIPEDLLEIISCEKGVARIVYQGILKPGKYLRAEIPLPNEILKGMVNIKATLCFSSPVDPEHVATYTKAGLEVFFRPDTSSIPEGKSLPSTAPFFKGGGGLESERRKDAHKWETVRQDSVRKRGSSLHKPCFDIHYIARDDGASPKQPVVIPYAMVITIEANKHPNLYNEILAAYTNILVPLQPKVSLPVKV